MKELEKLNSKSLEKEQLEGFWGGAKQNGCIDLRRRTTSNTCTINRQRNRVYDGIDSCMDY